MRYRTEIEFEQLGQQVPPDTVAVVLKFILTAIMKYKKRTKNSKLLGVGG